MADTKIVKNTTGTAVSLVEMAIDIPASGTYEITVQEFIDWARPEVITEVSPLITAGTLVINNGDQDLSPNEGINLLRYPDSQILNDGVLVRSQIYNFDFGNLLTAEPVGTRHAQVSIKADDVFSGCFLPQFTLSRSCGTIGVNRSGGFTLKRKCD